MSSHQTLKATKREKDGSAESRRLRRQGIVPAVVYGSQQRNYSIQVDAREFGDILRHQTSENFLVNLEIEGAQEKTKLAMVQDIQHDPLSGSVTHVDFHAVREDETVHAHIPIELTGSPAGVKLGGLLEHLIHSIEIHCRPADLPEKISHDVSGLEVGQGIHVRDLVFPDGVTSPMDGEVLVAIVAESRAAVSAGAGGSDESADAGEAPSA